ncbi:hypothetical protein KO465_02840 [Candidatus Micrarchaeota archaeon]|nr:hypothetical protein [Candidatus Micrarchaeota archaeon]
MDDTILFPGVELEKTMFGKPYTYSENDKVYSEIFGLLRGDRIVPLQGAYEPIVGDKIIGVVSEERFSSYNIYINTAYDTSLSTKMCRQELFVGDMIEAEVEKIDETKRIYMKYPKKLPHGSVIEVPAVKIPRLIGKQMSMLNLIKEKTGCDVKVGKNGLVWISDCENRYLVVNVINKIVREAHFSGLTSRIEEFLGQKSNEV